MDQCDLLLPYPPCLTGHLNLNGFGIGKALFTFDTFLLIVSGVFLGQVLSGVREGLTQQKLQILSDQHCCQPRSVSVLLPYFAV